jgi:hypothetical protein
VDVIGNLRSCLDTTKCDAGHIIATECDCRNPRTSMTQLTKGIWKCKRASKMVISKDGHVMIKHAPDGKTFNTSSKFTVIAINDIITMHACMIILYSLVMICLRAGNGSGKATRGKIKITKT